MNTNTSIKLAIDNLELMSVELERAAKKPNNYNTDLAKYLDNMAFEMRKNATDLSEKAYLFGIFYE